MTAPEWRDCADPDELAAAVAAGVEVQRNISGDVWHRIGHHRFYEFIYGMAHCARYRVPTAWTWRPEPPVPDDPWSKEALSLQPAPPWPGAVLSGLVDEDGVPTWLAQAGDVRGEQVRGSVGDEWGRNVDYFGAPDWVEVRAHRAVPEPETERVPWWDAVGDERLIDWMGDPDKASPAKSVGPWNDCPLTLWSGDKCSGMLAPVAPDGTVEVLRDGGR